MRKYSYMHKKSQADLFLYAADGEEYFVAECGWILIGVCTCI
jgi:hypothetical protein